mmetsp:Transcript_34071/g.108264  ORF Transcript_34071/g.108264 Transcript_34071/m.108264 type:complete len:216 (+) Transcript_34071:1593-2240(+)
MRAALLHGAGADRCGAKLGKGGEAREAQRGDDLALANGDLPCQEGGERGGHLRGDLIVHIRAPPDVRRRRRSQEHRQCHAPHRRHQRPDGARGPAAHAHKHSPDGAQTPLHGPNRVLHPMEVAPLAHNAPAAALPGARPTPPPSPVYPAPRASAGKAAPAVGEDAHRVPFERLKPRGRCRGPPMARPYPRTCRHRTCKATLGGGRGYSRRPPRIP